MKDNIRLITDGVICIYCRLAHIDSHQHTLSLLSRDANMVRCWWVKLNGHFNRCTTHSIHYNVVNPLLTHGPNKKCPMRDKRRERELLMLCSDKCGAMNRCHVSFSHLSRFPSKSYQIKWIWMVWLMCGQHCCLDQIYIVISEIERGWYECECEWWSYESSCMCFFFSLVFNVVYICIYIFVMDLIESVDTGFWLRLFVEHLCVPSLVMHANSQ